MIDPTETEIRGRWILVGGNVEKDEQCTRIEQLIGSELREIARDASGWEVLYVDPLDGRNWELTYPESNLHGGGPPMLREVTKEHARKKYGTS